MRAVLVLAIIVVSLFGSAGRWDLPLFWAFLGVLVAAMATASLVMDPDLARERFKPGTGGTDRGLRFVVLPFFVGHLVLAGMDVGRFHWSAPLPPWLSMSGLALLAASFILTLWAVHTNRFFSPVVRIQAERGHHLITGGPYRYIRHPGYVASLATCLGSGLALGSWLSFAPLVPVTVMILCRTIIEDRFLHEHLDGYAQFARQTRYRWIPGVW